MGDKLLIEVSRRLSACARKVDTIARIPGDHVARIGGDEFVMLLEDLSSPADALRVAERIHAALSEPFNLAGHDLVARGSVGIATSDAGYSRPEEVLRDADIALYQAKQAGKGCTCMFDPQMHQRAMARWSTETELRRAIERDEFELHYQPIVNGDGQLAALEALVRWRHPTRGLVMPDAFISIAEETGLIVPLGQAGAGHRLPPAAAVAARDPVAGAHGGGGEHLAPAVRVARGGRRHRPHPRRRPACAPQSLRLEVTETTAMQNAAQTIEIMARLRAMGVLIYMDDFGTGYSSLSQLQRMPLDALKIDRAFVKEMDRDATSRSIVDSIIALAHTMKPARDRRGGGDGRAGRAPGPRRLRLPAGLLLRSADAGRADRSLRRAHEALRRPPRRRALAGRSLRQNSVASSRGDLPMISPAVGNFGWRLKRQHA